MAFVWRLTPPAFADVLNGEGNRIFGARWNSPGRGVLYAGASLSLCALETLVHFPAVRRAEIPDFEAIHISVPYDAGMTQVSTADLESLLSAPHPERACREVGDRWLTEARHLVFVAPSVVVPEESNIMINPAHPRMKDVSIVRKRAFRFDPRLTVR